MAEGLSPRAAARVFNLSETTIRSWIARAGLHSRTLHDRLLRGLTLAHVQLDELRLKVKGLEEAVWLWVACDARTQLIPAFALGARTQAWAHQRVHEVAQRLMPDCLPVFSSDGLALYFYALTAHFGAWVQAAGERRPSWTVNVELFAKRAQVIKRYRCKRVAEVRHPVSLGTPDAYRQALGALGFSGRIQIHPERSRRTAFIERLHPLAPPARAGVTIRRSIAGWARRSWTLRAARSLGELALPFEGWRAIYHFARPHASLRIAMALHPSEGNQRQRYRQRTPAQAAGLTDHRWTVLELLGCPAPPLNAG